MTKTTTPPSSSSTGIDPIDVQLDNLQFNASPPDLDDSSSAESVTNKRPPPSLSGESQGGSDNLFNVSMPDVNDSSKRTSGVGIMMMKPGDLKNYCCGFVGTQKNAFCIKKRGECDTATHINNKFIPQEYRYYIQRSTTGNTAWCKPCVTELELANLPDASTTIFPPTILKTLKEWKGLFDAAKSIDSKSMDADDMKKHVAAFNTALPYESYKTPFKVSKTKLEDPTFASSDITSDVKAAMDYVTLENSSKFLSSDIDEAKESMEKLLLSVHYLLENFALMAEEIQNKVNLTDVAEDISNVTASISGLRSDVGINSTSPFPDLWTAVAELSTLCSVENWDRLTEGVKNLQEQMVVLEGHQQISNLRWKKLGENWIPLLVRHDKMVNKMAKYYLEMANKKHTPITMAQLDRVLDKAPGSIENVSGGASYAQALESRMNSTFSEMEERLTAFEEQLASKSLEMDNIIDNHMNLNNNDRDHSGGSIGVTFREFYFRDIDAVRAWMKKELEQPCHGLFVDLVSFMEFLGGERYIECNSTLNDLYLTNKVGFATQSDTIVAGSFHNILPAAYGRRPDGDKGNPNSASIDAQQELPGLPSFEKWDHRDGSTGRKYWIKKETHNTNKQLSGMIRHQLTGKAQILASELLMESKTMSDALYQFISTSFEDITHSEKFDDVQAWQLTCKFVKRVFSEIGDVRVIARHGIDTEDKWTTSARFLFATLKAHEVMDSFMRLNIKDHPSISSEMVKFICYAQPSSEASTLLSRMSNLETLQRGDQSQISRLETKVKSLQSWKSDAERLLKNMKDK